MTRAISLLAGIVSTTLLSAQTGANCANAVPVDIGTHTAPSDNYYYVFVPDQTGTYLARTCGLMTCDTKLWAYDFCTGLIVNEQGQNALEYNDDICGYQSIISMALTEGETYYIRVGDYNDACAGQQVTWELVVEHLVPDPIVCDAGEVEITVVLTPDDLPGETSWDVVNAEGVMLANGGATGAQFCVPEEECVVFTIHDQYGDGLHAPGGFWIYRDGVQVGSGGVFNYQDVVETNCPAGFSCGTPLDITTGSHSATHNDFWYAFVPDVNGMYSVSTCAADCDTRIWIYDHCDNLIWDDTNVGAIYFNDGNAACGEQADVDAILEAGETYFIRIGAPDGACTGAIPWTLTYDGGIVGCMDPAACNYDPLATVAGTCIMFGDPECPNGPDLTVRSDVLQNSIQLGGLNVGPTDCYIAEGCLDGYGVREIVRFTTHIQNIGNQDFYIGNPGSNPDQFNMVNCHGHAHYEGYAEYLLYNTDGETVVDGFKNGFCVLDLECSMGGTAQYGCNNMGISTMCGDIYNSSLSCQWVDITGVPEGTYTLVVRTNWDNSPDAVGRYETDINNNWAQACLFIDRTPTLSVSVVANCQPYVDCLGNIYGSATYDCLNVCDGDALIGDLNTDSSQDQSDVVQYVSGILGNDIEALPCTDIDMDGNITVSDAAFIAFCDYWNTYNHTPDQNAVHDHCNFPFNEIINPFDSVTFSLGAVDMAEGYLDVLVKNPNRRIVGYELMISGVQITAVENLIDPQMYPVDPQFAFGTGHLIVVSDVDSTIQRNNDFVPLCRVHFSDAQQLICISEVIDVVNENYMNSTTFLENACATFTGISTQDVGTVRVYPNPFKEQTVVIFPAQPSTPAQLLLTDLQGREVRRYSNVTNGRVTIERGALAQGAYLYRLTGPVQASGRLLVE
ncbi:MAG TPA: lysyl oxidase family protein [Flavobacteriales bacterium]|nr:lysyl oxidase family protein [Flavobacteriales bacterium]